MDILKNVHGSQKHYGKCKKLDQKTSKQTKKQQKIPQQTVIPFVSMVFNQGHFCPPRQHLAVSGNIFRCHIWQDEGVAIGT